MKMIERTFTVGIALLAMITAAVVVKLYYFPTFKDAYFKSGLDNLRQVPSGIVAIRPAHFAHSTGNQIWNLQTGGSVVRALGRDVILRNLIAEAYDCSPGRVVLPSDVPKDCFDFLVTTPSQTREHLQAAIRKDLDYTAQRETLDTNVLRLTVANPRLPGMTVSANNKQADITYKAGKLYFRHQKISILLFGLQGGLARPVLDETGLTNFYDFSLDWNRGKDQAMHNGTFNLNRVQEALNIWGLKLEPGTASLDMVIVTKAR